MAARRATGVVFALGLSSALIWPALELFGQGAVPSPTPEHRARAAAQDFLDRYVERDGRVVRRDQGGDTVSEGVSYALLLANVAGDRRTFARVWRWARLNLQRPDGLLASRATRKRVVDPMPASDADLVTAWALSRYSGPRASRYHVHGVRLARAVLRHETASRGRRLVLAAGPWATGEPTTLNPSYWAIQAFRELARRTGDKRWLRVSASSVRVTRKLTANGRALPPDWARMDRMDPAPTPAPNGEARRVRYGLDAQRLVVWMATACNPAANRLARSWWKLLSRPGRERAIALAPNGALLDRRTSPLPFVAAAAAAAAAGDTEDRDRLLDGAERTDVMHPAYYGSAWVALGRALLTTRLLGGCAGGGRG